MQAISDHVRCAVAVDAVEPPDVVDFSAMFGNARPVEMEIGCGKGGFLLAAARTRPDHNFFAVEWANRYFRYAVDRMQRWGVANVRIMRVDARILVERCLPPHCLWALHVYHPDPWPKKRHHKRRLFRPEFVDAVVRVLRPGARLAITTDHAEYFDVIAGLTQGHPDLLEAAFDDPQYGVTDGRVETNFEIKYRREGRPIYRLAFCRAPTPAGLVGDAGRKTT